MSAEHWVTNLVDALEALKQQVFSVEYELFQGVPEGDIEDLVEEAREETGIADFQVSPVLATIYRQTTGLNFYWEGELEGSVVRGGARLQSWGSIYEPGFEDGVPFSSIFEERRLFDDAVDEKTFLRFDRACPHEPELHYWLQATESFYRLDLNLSEYFDRLLASRGMDPWTHFFIADPAFPKDQDRMSRFLEAMPRLFPESDLSPWTHGQR